MMMLLLCLLSLLTPPSSAAAPIDKARLAEHIHKAFSTPAAMKLTVGELSPSPVPGWLGGTVDASDGERRSAQPILVSEDGRWYFLGAMAVLGASPVPGMKAFPEDPNLPPVHLFPDGKHAVVGTPKDLSVDPDAANRAKISLKDAPATGPADAALTLVEYSDLQCPHCKKSHEILEAELAKLPIKLRRVFKHYPLDMHAWSYDAAIAAACASRVKPAAGNAVLHRFFAEQEKITPADVRAKSLEFAKAAGLPEAAFAACVDKKETKAVVEADKREGDSLGVTGTPTLFINGRKVRGYAWSEVKAVIDELSKAAKK
ncbi:MAG: thioredoxin domain-containing protein [Elusimicrobia bacterium]|nr:thioredoxin domain-containing protein [Elusimicrobiota bacterium]